MDGNNVKKYDKNRQLSCRIYSFPAAARLLLQRLSQLYKILNLDKMQFRSMERSDKYVHIYSMIFLVLFLSSIQMGLII